MHPAVAIAGSAHCWLLLLLLLLLLMQLLLLLLLLWLWLRLRPLRPLRLRRSVLLMPLDRLRLPLPTDAGRRAS